MYKEMECHKQHETKMDNKQITATDKQKLTITLEMQDQQ